MFNFKKLSVRSIVALVLTLAALIIASAFMIGFTETKQITVIDNGSESIYFTNKSNVADFIADKDIVLNANDKISKNIKDKFTDNDILEIKRAKTITITVDGETKNYVCTERYLKPALLELGITLDIYDEIEPCLETEITDGLSVTIFRVNVSFEEKEEVVASNIVEKPNADLSAGTRKVIANGSDGLKNVKRRIVTRDGNEIINEIVAENTITEAVDTVVEVGCNNKKIVAASKDNLDVKKVINVTATAYTASAADNGKWAGKTATGRTPAYGVIAVDPKVIPLGTKLYIESSDGGQSWVYGYAVAGDTGGAIKGNKIDLFFHSNGECTNFGRRSATVYVLE